MKREIREKVREFKKKEEEFIIAISKNPDDSKLKAEYMKLRKEIRSWLNEIGGRESIKNAEDAAMLDTLVSDAEHQISRAAKKNIELNEFISESAKRARDVQPGYERTMDDKGQIAAIAEISAMDKVKKIDKFNKKRNKKSFLNIVICKFKKSKQQSQEQENQGPSQN